MSVLGKANFSAELAETLPLPRLPVPGDGHFIHPEWSIQHENLAEYDWVASRLSYGLGRAAARARGNEDRHHYRFRRYK